MARTTGTASLADLIRSGVLHEGDQIEIRRRSAPAIVATLSADGSIILGRTSFRTPTAAAKEALNVGSIDGWIRWRVPRLGGKSLADLRESESS
jgi:hypothetical protein